MTSARLVLFVTFLLGCSGRENDPGVAAAGGGAATTGTTGGQGTIGGSGSGNVGPTGGAGDSGVGARATTGGTGYGGFGTDVPSAGGANNGGTTSSGGTASIGGTGRGGASTGGAVATGGASTGGGTAIGGTMATGGTKATGGTTVTGGTKATGGTTVTGGTKATGGTTATGGASNGNPPSGTVRVFYLYPSDVAFDQRYPDGIGNVMLETQAFFKQQLGKTFKLNNPIVELVSGEHARSWYENTPNGGDKYWWSAMNGMQEVQRRFKLPDSRWMGVSEVSAEGDGAGGGASGGWVLLCGHDADGGAAYPANKARWVGGMVHEMGHAFGLPDSTSTDGTCMSASFYGWPNCTFTQSQKEQMLNGRWGSDKFLF